MAFMLNPQAQHDRETPGIGFIEDLTGMVSAPGADAVPSDFYELVEVDMPSRPRT